MTKNRARKHAARQRAAVTGEPYVVARRQLDVHAPRDAGRLHDLTHRVPGVPEHVDGGLQSSTRRTRRTTPVHTQPTHGAPRVLVGWQNRIARLFGAK